MVGVEYFLRAYAAVSGLVNLRPEGRKDDLLSALRPYILLTALGHEFDAQQERSFSPENAAARMLSE
jgi:hypothetical protein